jgi:anti-sigma factor RsiW
MAGQHWTEKLDAYLDGELTAEDERQLRLHLRECAGCAAAALERLQLKRTVQSAGVRFRPDPAFRARIEQSIRRKTAPSRVWSWAPAMAVLLIAVLGVSFWTMHFRTHMRERQLVSELIDQHVATLASSNPVDVVSTDRHTVKPWFEGKLPFTFDIPELQGTPFTLVGGRMSYLNQTPLAELLFRLRQHQLSVFVFQKTEANGECRNVEQGANSFQVRSWSSDGLCYFAVGDVNADDLNALAKLMKAPAP